MSILWKGISAKNALYFNNLQNLQAGDLSKIRFLEERIQLSKAQFALRIADLDHPGTYGKRASRLHDRLGC
jgi:hypothetical protein